MSISPMKIGRWRARQLTKGDCRFIVREIAARKWGPPRFSDECAYLAALNSRKFGLKLVWARVMVALHLAAVAADLRAGLAAPPYLASGFDVASTLREMRYERYEHVMARIEREGQ